MRDKSRGERVRKKWLRSKKKKKKSRMKKNKRKRKTKRTKVESRFILRWRKKYGGRKRTMRKTTKKEEER